jgi:hypothetical protein
MTDPIRITAPAQLPAGVNLYGPLTPEEYVHTKIEGRAYELVHQFPEPYSEIYIDASKLKDAEAESPHA